jgi:hypothetical protein
MMICKIPQHDVAVMLQTLNQLSITPGIDNADMYVGLGLMLRNAIANAVDEPEEVATDG